MTNILPDNFQPIDEFVDGMPAIVTVAGQRVVGAKQHGPHMFFLTENGTIGPFELSAPGQSPGTPTEDFSVTFKLIRAGD